jgi:hypothetical protein
MCHSPVILFEETLYRTFHVCYIQQFNNNSYYYNHIKCRQLLGPFKRYQIFQILYTSFGCLLSLAYPLLIYVFAGKIICIPVTLLK